VAISNNFIIVGAQRHDSAGVDSGAAYIYAKTEDGWEESAKLVAPDATENQRFGISVAINGDVVVIGANGDDDNGENAGAAYIYTLVGDEWFVTQKLTAPDGDAGDNFGFSVGVYGNQAVIGSVWDNEKSGSVYIYILIDGVWTVEGKFTKDGAEPDDQFGWAVSIYEETIAVGAFADDANGLDSGAAYVFEKDDRGVWRQAARVTPDDAADNDHFGRSLDVHEDWLIVSAPFDDDAGLESGSVYIYQRDDSDWVLQAKVLPALEPSDFFEFGYGVSVSDSFFVISSKGLNETLSRTISSSGHVYVYDTYLPGSPTASPTSSLMPTIVTYPPTSHPSISLMPSTSPPTFTQMPSFQPTEGETTVSPTESATTEMPTSSPVVAPTSSTVNPSSSPTDMSTTSSPTPGGTTPFPTYLSTLFPTFTKPPQVSSLAPTMATASVIPTTILPTLGRTETPSASTPSSPQPNAMQTVMPSTPPPNLDSPTLMPTTPPPNLGNVTLMPTTPTPNTGLQTIIPTSSFPTTPVVGGTNIPAPTLPPASVTSPPAMSGTSVPGPTSPPASSSSPPNGSSTTSLPTSLFPTYSTDSTNATIPTNPPIMM